MQFKYIYEDDILLTTRIEMFFFVKILTRFLSNVQLSIHVEENTNKRTMMVLYRSPEYQVVKVYNGYKYQIS